MHADTTDNAVPEDAGSRNKGACVPSAAAPRPEVGQALVGILALLPDAHVLVADGVVVDCNRAAANMLGRTREQTVGRSIVDLSPEVQPDGTPSAEAAEKRTGEMRHGEGRVFEWMHRRADGTDLQVEVSATNVAVEGGLLLLASWRDVTDRKRAAERLEESEENFREWVESLGDMMAVASLDGKLLYGNTGLRRALAYSERDLTAIRVVDLYSEAGRRSAEAAFLAAIDGEYCTARLLWVTTTGRMIPIEARTWAGRWNGAPCVFTLAKDITVEQESQQRFEHLFRGNPALMMLSSLPDQMLTDVNDAFLAHTGYRRDEVVGKPLDQLELFASVERQAAILGRRRPGHIPETELQIKCRNGDVLDVLYSGEVMAGHSKMYSLAVMVDITARKRVEKSLHAANTELAQTVMALESANLALEQFIEVAEQANLAKSQFLANMSHELRTPLHGILSFATFGIKKIETAPRKDLLRYFTHVDQSGKVLLGLVNDLLDLAKLESGKVQCQFGEANVTTIVHAVSDEFATQVANRGIAMRIHAVVEGADCVGDADRLAQVVRNLLSNAVKFSGEGTAIDVTVTPREESIRVGIADCGVGIPEDELDSIFDEFVQSSKTRTGAGGTGLGLAICRRIIGQHSGRIWAENRPEGGALITFEVARKPATDGAAPQPTAIERHMTALARLATQNAEPTQPIFAREVTHDESESNNPAEEISHV